MWELERTANTCRVDNLILLANGSVSDLHVVIHLGSKVREASTPRLQLQAPGTNSQ